MIIISFVVEATSDPAISAFMVGRARVGKAVVVRGVIGAVGVSHPVMVCEI